MTPRIAFAMLCAGALAGCGTVQDPVERAAADQQRLASIIGSRTPGAPQECIYAYPNMEIRAIGDDVLARYGDQMWVNDIQGSCSLAYRTGAVLAAESDTTGRYCVHDTFRIVSTSNGMPMGSCMMGPWIPYN